MCREGGPCQVGYSTPPVRGALVMGEQADGPDEHISASRYGRLIEVVSQED
jgi:hypothetical protein